MIKTIPELQKESEKLRTEFEALKTRIELLENRANQPQTSQVNVNVADTQQNQIGDGANEQKGS